MKTATEPAAGSQPVVIEEVKPESTVMHPGERPEMTRELAESLAIDFGTPPDFDSVAFLRSLKK